MQQNVKSYVRVRPVIEQDVWGDPMDHSRGMKTMAPLCVVVDQDERTVVIKSKLYEHRQFRCARAFDHVSDQQVVYKRTISRDIKQGVLTEGKDLTVLAYGVTGTGKSYTIFNYEPETRRTKLLPDASKRLEKHEENRHTSDGIAFQCIDELFRAKECNDNIVISIAFCQLYMEKFYDLLSNDGKPRDLRESSRHGVFVDGLESIQCSSSKDAYDVIQTGLSARVRRRTALNIGSSRSHAILTISISSGAFGDNKPATVRFFDLAGSEKLSASESRANKSTLKESVTINKSIACLSNVIHKLSAKQKKDLFVPFRDSKLTRLLSSSLHGAAQMSIISHISPTQEYYESTLSTLKFALKAMKIAFSPEVVPDNNRAKPNIGSESVGDGTHLYMMKNIQPLPIPTSERVSHPYLPQSLNQPAHQSAVPGTVERKDTFDQNIVSKQSSTPQKMYTSRSVRRMMRSLDSRKLILQAEIEAMEQGRLAQAERSRQLNFQIGVPSESV
jgi:hypothetical protein